MSKHTKTTANRLEVGQHFWYMQKMYLVHAVKTDGWGTHITTGTKILILAPYTRVDIHES